VLDLDVDMAGVTDSMTGSITAMSVIVVERTKRPKCEEVL
jgi:hypothetical protein